MMKDKKMYIALIVGLVVANIALSLTLYFGQVHHRPHRQPKAIIIERLHFSPQQREAYEKLIRQHRDEVQHSEKNLMLYKTKLYQTLNAGGDSSTVALFDSVALYQSRIEHTHYTHFADIKKLCTPAQQKDFDALTNELARLFLPKPMHRK